MPAPQNIFETDPKHQMDSYDSHTIAEVLLGIVIAVWLSLGFLLMLIERISR